MRVRLRYVTSPLSIGVYNLRDRVSGKKRERAACGGSRESIYTLIGEKCRTGFLVERTFNKISPALINK